MKKILLCLTLCFFSLTFSTNCFSNDRELVLSQDIKESLCEDDQFMEFAAQMYPFYALLNIFSTVKLPQVADSSQQTEPEAVEEVFEADTCEHRSIVNGNCEDALFHDHSGMP